MPGLLVLERADYIENKDTVHGKVRSTTAKNSENIRLRQQVIQRVVIACNEVHFLRQTKTSDILPEENQVGITIFSDRDIEHRLRSIDAEHWHSVLSQISSERSGAATDVSR
jgi:hypothetical protein